MVPSTRDFVEYSIASKYTDKSLTDSIDQQDQELRNIDLVLNTELLTKESKTVYNKEFRLVDEQICQKDPRVECKDVTSRQCHPVIKQVLVEIHHKVKSRDIAGKKYEHMLKAPSTELLAKEKRQVDRVNMRRYIQSTMNTIPAVTHVRQIQEQCKEVSTRERCHL